MKLSIIIPVYNVEKYVEKCIRSCAEQNTSPIDYEIIIVNDGTKDNSLIIAQEVAQEYTNISIVSQENGGLSSARNKGISLAKGDYVWFVDSDDWIADNCLQDIFNALNNDIDCLTFNYNKYFSSKKNGCISEHFEGVKTGIELMLLCKIFTPAQFTIYRKSLFAENNLAFYEGIYYEDSDFTPRAFFFAEKCCSINKVCYYYLQRESGSIMSSFNLKKAHDILFVNNRLLDFSKEHIHEKSKKSIFYYWIGLNTNSFLSRIGNLNTTELKEIEKFFLSQKEMFKAMVYSRKIKYKLEGILFFLFPKFTLFLYRFLNK